MASVTGPAEGVRALLDAASLPGQAEVLGPVPGGYASPDSPPGAPGDPAEQVRMLVRVPRPAGPALARALHDAQAVRSARKDAGGVRVQLDPPELI
jgi:primosomal protein N' (replication factor Y)